MVEIVKDEVKKMLELNIIELLESFYLFFIVFVVKKDGLYWFCVDFCLLNKIIVFDVELMLNVDVMFLKLVGYVYFLWLDLLKGYW